MCIRDSHYCMLYRLIYKFNMSYLIILKTFKYAIHFITFISTSEKISLFVPKNIVYTVSCICVKATVCLMGTKLFSIVTATLLTGYAERFTSKNAAR